MTEQCTIIRRFLFELVEIHRNYWEIINKFIICFDYFGFYSNVYLKLRKYYNLLEQKILDVRLRKLGTEHLKDWSVHVGFESCDLKVGKFEGLKVSQRLECMTKFVVENDLLRRFRDSRDCKKTSLQNYFKKLTWMGPHFCNKLSSIAS